MSKSAELVRLIRDRAGPDAPEYGLILGSGLGHIAATVEGIADIRASDEGREGVQSFLQKRKPGWLV